MASPLAAMSSTTVCGFRQISGVCRHDQLRESSALFPRSNFGDRVQNRMTSRNLEQTPRHLLTVRATASAERFSSPKMGAVGEDRFRENAAQGTFWGPLAEGGHDITVVFIAGDEKVAVNAKSGENLLRVAERCGALVPNTDFCYEGTCCHCEMEVEGGAPEVGYRANTSSETLVRSCICPVPSRDGPLNVRVLSEDSAWDDVL